MNSERPTRPPRRGLVGFNVITGILLGIVGFYFGWWLGHQIHFTNYEYTADTGQNDIALLLGYLFFVVGFLAGLGYLRYPLARKAASGATSASAPTTRWSGCST